MPFLELSLIIKLAADNFCLRFALDESIIEHLSLSLASTIISELLGTTIVNCMVCIHCLLHT